MNYSQLEQALVIVEMTDLFQIYHFAHQSNITAEASYEMDYPTRFKLTLDGAAGMVAAEDFRTAWDFGQEFFYRGQQDRRARQQQQALPPEQRGLPSG